MPNAKKLRFKCINDLLDKAKLDYNVIKPHNVYRRLSSMFKIAKESWENGDDETAYIMFRRWLNSVEWLRKTREYREDKALEAFYSSNARSNQVNEVKTILADLDKKLDATYKQSLTGTMLGKLDISDRIELKLDPKIKRDSHVPTIDGPLALPETPTKDPLSDNDEYMTCDQLFQAIQKRNNESKFLIIDVRPKSKYEKSRILSDQCINIPETEIRQGVLPMHLEQYLHSDLRSYHLFRKRGAQHTDVIVIVDWNGSTGVTTQQNPVSTLKHILEDWDPSVKYNKILVLDGGYQEWVTRYPAFTSNPNITEPASTNTGNEILDDIVYPEWIHSDDEDGIIKMREKEPVNLNTVKRSERIIRPDSSRDRFRYKATDVEMNNTPSTRTVNHNANTIPQPMEVEPSEPSITLQPYENGSKYTNQRSPSPAKQVEIPTKPTVDRSSKPATLKSQSSEAAHTVLKLTRQLAEMAKKKEKLEREILEQERALNMQQGFKYTDPAEEECIRKNLTSLYAQSETEELSYEKLFEQLDNYEKQTPSIEWSDAEKNERDKVHLNLASAKWRIKDIVGAREELKRKAIQNEQKSELKETKEAGSIHKEPLKSENFSISPGLERSYSTPNLFQLGNELKAPRVDRSSKPQIFSHNRNGSIGNETVKASHLTWANREERMTPVHGSVHPGITGLKNLGNSCYMNSIIQCLSNTTYLAKYFTDNLYVDDLNTNNESTTHGQVVEEVAQVIKALWRGQYKSISPHDLKVCVGQYKLQFESYDQQDSHEFLTFLLDWMHNDLRKEYKMTHELSVAEKAWDKAMDSQKSIISDLFFGQLRSTITCSTCKQGSTTYETFNSLTTSLPHSSRCTLNDCIQKFVIGQKVVGWKCPKCDTPREATKKFDFVKLAPIIVIHLNRFAESGGWLEKRNTAVEFPLTGFNLKPYLVTDSNSPTISNLRNYNYSLYAMSNHYGTMEGGHYTAFCKNAAQNKWYKYDDQTVTEVTPNQVKSQTNTAYLLFYTSFSSNII